ncbi:beta-xylosidase family glycoside hydrolase [Agromyces sp. ZXT2-3]|uniref:beta-xylosidase family glycoside hydrolase n=1 Tax=Agromyces sp. ZXT2-3 TaxID=3461152 RepID=UPI004055277F
MPVSRRPRAAAIAAIAALAIAPFTAVAPATAAEPFPDFVYQGIITDKSEMIYNPTNEFIFPSVFHAGEYLDDPLGEWYLYLAPHDRPAGVMLMYADSLDGPWTEYAANPIIASDWSPHYDVSHVSSPDAVWNEEAGEVFLYFHGENSVTRYATSSDGVHFEYGDVVVSNAMGGPDVTETSYARVFEHPDPSSGYRYGMFYMANFTDNHRRLKLAESTDGVTWDVRPGTVVEPESGDSGNVSGGNLWEWGGQLYVIYHNSAGSVMARTIDPTLSEVGDAQVLHRSSGVGEDVGRTAAPEIVAQGDHTYLFYESGDRLGATIAWAKAGPGVEFPGGPDPVAWPVDPENPVFEQCAAAGTDEFEGDALSIDWDRVVRPETARHSVADGVLTIPAYEGGVAAASLPQQELPEGPWQLTTKLTIDVAERFQQAGLLLYASDTVYGKFDLGRATPGTTLEVVRYLNGNNRQDSAAPAVPEADTVWLRMTSDGVAIQSSVSYDGVTFSDYGRPFLFSETPFTHVGPYAFRGSLGAEEIDGTFDWFRWSPTPEDYEACLAELLPDDDETDAPGTTSLTSTSGWAYGLDDGNFDVRMDLWWGTNATRFRLYQDDELIATVPLEPSSPDAQHAVVPIAGLPNGTYEFRGELANSQGTTPTKPLTVKVTDAEPGLPKLSHDDWDRDGTFTLSADLWWGTNAYTWRLLQDGEEVASGTLVAATPAAQHVEVPITDLTGEHVFVMEFGNGAGTTASKPLTVG